MNKIFLWIVLAVIILGLLLILLNTRMGQSGDAQAPADNSVSAPVTPAPPVAQPPLPVTPGSPADGEKLAAAGVKPSPAAVERGFAFDTGEETAAATAGDTAPAGPGMAPPAAAGHDEKARPVPAPAPAEKKAEKPAAKPQPAPRKAAPAPRDQTISNFVVFVRDGGATIRLDASSPIRFKHLELTSPARVVVDLHGTWKLSEPGVPKGEMVKDVRLGKKGGDTRIVIDLHAKARTRYILTRGKKRLDIRLDKTKCFPAANDKKRQGLPRDPAVFSHLEKGGSRLPFLYSFIPFPFPCRAGRRPAPRPPAGRKGPPCPGH